MNEMKYLKQLKKKLVTVFRKPPSLVLKHSCNMNSAELIGASMFPEYMNMSESDSYDSSENDHSSFQSSPANNNIQEQLPPLVNPRPRPVNYNQQDSFYAIDQQRYYHGQRDYIERQRYHSPIQNQWYQTPVPQRQYPTHRYPVHQHPIQQFSPLQPLDFNRDTQTDEEPIRKHQKFMFTKQTELCMSSVIAIEKDASPNSKKKIRLEKNKLNNAIRKVVEDSDLRTVKGEAFNTCFEMLKKYIPNLNRDPALVRHVRIHLRKNMNYRLHKETVPDNKPKPQSNRMPTDYLEFDTTAGIPNFLQCGSEVCLNYQGYPVGKAKVVSYPASVEGMTETERKEFVLLQMTLKRRNSDVTVFPYRTEYRSWDNVGKGARFAWSVAEVQPAEEYDNFIKDKRRVQQKFVYQQAKQKKRQVQPEVQQPDLEEPELVAEPEEAEPEVVEPEVVEPEVVEEPEVEKQTEEPEQLQQQPDVEQQPINHQRIQISDYVEVALEDPKRKTAKNFYGMIIGTDPLEIKFMKNTSKKNVKVWPQVEDISVLETCQLVRHLGVPTLDHRLRYVFMD
ncbi:uncharacterized protein LOC127715379 isoform X16 [Mytilus californianus]|uniref:uncharacterized protein LOC127715379 isoform X16 n=1 Tax=Mytilus californianus TaxID=6549 RepID=UPI00224629A1|nr:uncharacterized protein LOC127715379 isoform X16 [Mytilus californianus]